MDSIKEQKKRTIIKNLLLTLILTCDILSNMRIDHAIYAGNSNRVNPVNSLFPANGKSRNYRREDSPDPVINGTGSKESSFSVLYWREVEARKRIEDLKKPVLYNGTGIKI